MYIHVHVYVHLHVCAYTQCVFTQGLVYKVELFQPEEKAWLGYTEVNTVQKYGVFVQGSCYTCRCTWYSVK